MTLFSRNYDVKCQEVTKFSVVPNLKHTADLVYWRMYMSLGLTELRSDYLPAAWRKVTWDNAVPYLFLALHW